MKSLDLPMWFCVPWVAMSCALCSDIGRLLLGIEMRGFMGLFFTTSALLAIVGSAKGWFRLSFGAQTQQRATSCFALWLAALSILMHASAPIALLFVPHGCIASAARACLESPLLTCALPALTAIILFIGIRIISHRMALQVLEELKSSKFTSYRIKSSRGIQAVNEPYADCVFVWKSKWNGDQPIIHCYTSDAEKTRMAEFLKYSLVKEVHQYNTMLPELKVEEVDPLALMALDAESIRPKTRKWIDVIAFEVVGVERTA